MERLMVLVAATYITLLLVLAAGMLWHGRRR